MTRFYGGWRRPTAQPKIMPVSEHVFRRSFFRGYRRGDVDSAVAGADARAEQLEWALNAATQRSRAMQIEIDELHARVLAVREREEALCRTLDELHAHRELRDREALVRANAVVLEAEERAQLLKTEAIRQVGELQRQVEQLLGMRAGLTQAMRRISEDIAGAMARLATSPATAIDHQVEDQVARWSDDSEH